MRIVNGWLEEARRAPSPNFNARPQNVEIDLLVIHNISLPPGEFNNGCIEKFFQNCLPWQDHPYFESIKGLEVSSHFLIQRDGQIVQFVSCDDRAWHAGKSCFGRRENCNDFSIGIELEGTDDLPYESIQYATLARLTKSIQESYPCITRSNIAGHSDISPDRKTDPGESFDWHRYFIDLDRI